jgi:deoxyadenosine/deoxycytidine kinase
MRPTVYLCQLMFLVSGFLKYSNNSWILPDPKGVNNLKRKIYEDFHMFKAQIISEGPMKVSESGLAHLKLTTKSGMSGSPILLVSNFSYL